MHRWTDSVHYTEKKGSWWAGGSEILWRVLPNTWTPYHIPILEEKLPNGNLLCYTYTPWKEEKQNFPHPQLLASITAYNSDKTHVLGYIHFHYPRDKNGDIAGIQLTGSDSRSSLLQHQHIGKSPIKLASAQRAGQPLTTYGSHNTLLNTVAKPDGRALTTEYNTEGQVIAQYAPVGSEGKMSPIARYEYHPNLTIFYDAENNKTQYRYDADKKLLSLETFLDNTLYRIDRFTWDPITGNLTRKTIEDPTGTPLHITEYQYDKNHNPILEKVGDGKEWRTLKRTYSEDGYNLKLSESDREDTITRYTYLPKTNLLLSEIVYEKNIPKKRTFHFYDTCAICIKTLVDDGSTEDPHNLKDITYRTLTYTTPKKTLPCFGLPETVEEKTLNASGQEILLHKTHYTYTPFGKILKEEHFDATDTYCYFILNTYDEKERLISTTDPLGNKTEFGYDSNHNLTSLTKPHHYQEITYDPANRPILLADWQTDGTLLFLEKKYDKLGQLIEESDACKNSTLFHYDALGRLTTIHHPDAALEKKEYNLLGHLIQETDPLGYTTKKEYNVYGQITTIYHPQGPQEHFTYNPTGTISSHTDKNGCTSLYTYDIFDHPLSSTTLFDHKILKKNQSTYTPFCKLTETDGEGNTTTYTYDFSGRKTSETTATKKTHFVYAPSGLLEKTDCEYFQQIEHHDTAGHLISKELVSDTLQFQEKYTYDAASRPTHRITSHGAFETVHHTLGKPLIETNPLGYTTEYAYHFSDHYRQITTDANQIQTIRIHDKRGREIACLTEKGETFAKSESQYDPCGNLTTLTQSVFKGSELIKTITHRWEYGPGGRLEKFLEAGKKQTQHLYDEKGRLRTTVKPSGIQFHHTYDPLGRLARYSSSDFDYHYTYDRNDRLLSVSDTITKSTTTRTYNPLGGMTQETLATNLSFFNTFDNQGRRTKLTLPDSSEIQYAYRGAFLYQVTRKENTFTYQTRDLEGCPLELKVPKLGTIKITRDGLSRIATFESSVYSSLFPKDAYDPVGNLVHYKYKDPLGSNTCTYTYDPLNQLIAEEGHTYLFDSIHNRLEKDQAPHTVNSLCQILDDGNTQYAYDLDGNLIFDGQWRYTYDTQDRLIALEKDKKRIEYTYDPFHRRLSKTVYLNNKRTDYERYLWDGDNEIGAVDEKGKITQLRVLGEGLGAEIGSAVLLELKGKTYLPIHDHNGNVAVIIDLKTQKPVETCRYTAFGEEIGASGEIRCPWRFSSKRSEEETGLIFFGRRYYLPKLGRWVTQDPQGFDDGPNLYAYLSNSPLIHIDLYGLMACDRWWSLQDDYTGLTRRAIGNLFGKGLPKDYSHFENSFSNKSRTYNLNQHFNFDFAEPTIGAYLFGNGIGNKFSDVGEKALQISEYSGYNTSGVFNSTHGFFIDLHESFANLHSHAMTPPVYLYHQVWDTYFDKDITGAPLFQSAHSQGVAQVRNALEVYNEERRQRIIVAAFAPLAYISPKLCMQVTHYVCPSDPVPYHFDKEGKRACEDTIIYVPKMPKCRQSCHEFLNPIYLPHLEREIYQYQDLLKKYVR